MSSPRRAVSLLMAALLVQACAVTAFTQDYRREHALRDADLRGRRFYTSGELVLQRASALREPGSDEGVYRTAAATMVQEIVIPAGTGLTVLKVVRAPASAEPGAPEVEYMQLALSRDAPGKSLWFSTLRPALPGHYQLTSVAQLGEDGKPVLGPADNLRYDGFDYHLRDAGMWHVYLTVREAIRAHVSVSARTGP